MADADVALPTGVGGSVIYGCAGPRPTGVCFCLRLPFRDETRNPPSAGQFDHEWVVSRQELDQAEALALQDLALAPDLDPAMNAFLGRELMQAGLLGKFGFLDRKTMRRRTAEAFASSCVWAFASNSARHANTKTLRGTTRIEKCYQLQLRIKLGSTSDAVWKRSACE